jgi:peptide/nickel transport system permease protein
MIYKKNHRGMLGLIIIIIVVILAVFSPTISPYNPTAMVYDKFLAPSKDHILGTDNLGRDLFSRIIHGTRISLLFGFGVSTLSLVIGVFLGATAGYFGGFIDDILSRFFEIMLMIPAIFLIILVSTIFRADIRVIMIIVGATIWPSNARIARSQVLTIKTRAFVQAARGSGAGHFRLLFYHILPNGIYPIIVNSTLQMGSAIITEASLSFLGLGDPNHISWGQMISVAQMYIRYAWWMALFPGLAITILVLGFSFIGDGLNYAMNPRLREH